MKDRSCPYCGRSGYLGIIKNQEEFYNSKIVSGLVFTKCISCGVEFETQDQTFHNEKIYKDSQGYE